LSIFLSGAPARGRVVTVNPFRVKTMRLDFVNVRSQRYYGHGDPTGKR
jgi:hypothetical protein